MSRTDGRGYRLCAGATANSFAAPPGSAAGPIVRRICAREESGARSTKTCWLSSNTESEKPTKKKTNMSNYNKLYTAADSAIVFIDHQPQMTFGVSSIDRATLMNNVTL